MSNGVRSPLSPQTTLSKSLVKKTKTSETSDIITITPNPIIFYEYEADAEFEQIFLVRNVSHNSISVRIGRPTTKFFSISFMAKADAPIAPGMSCKFLVKFKPNHVSDFDDCVDIITNDGRVSLLLQGRRPHPVLTLPRVLDCGFCHVDTETTTQYQVANTGSFGRFRFIDQPSMYFN